MKVDCPHCSQRISLDGDVLDSLRGAAGFQCPACAGHVPLPDDVPDASERPIRPHSPHPASPKPPGGSRPTSLMALQPAALPRIGFYQLMEKLGEGGFGIVYRAEREEPIHREVALKIIKPGMDSREIIQRFEAERQALALMEHPNIAAVLDAGTAATGLPFFVMELVRGQPITTYCDEHQLTIRQRLELFIPVCHAVQHAHQKAVLHRDLKPSNIMVLEVDGKAVPKVIDFGIAKALGAAAPADFHENMLRTLAGTVIGTPQYMSPEQAGAAPDLDTRSDIYTLGVILYELLTGKTPLSEESLRRAALDELLRMIREAEPLRPSSRVIPITEANRLTAELRQTEPIRLNRQLRGELDWIILKTLEKERERRYDSAAALSADLERYLAHEPVAAGPPGVLYRFKKLVRRNRLAFGAAAAVLLLLVGGISVSTWQWREAVRERKLKQAEYERAEQEAAVSKAVSEFLRKDLLAAANTDEEPGRDLKVRTLLDRAAARIGDRFGNQPLVEAEISRTLGICYLSLTEEAQALKLALRSVDLFHRALGPEHSKTLNARGLVLDTKQLQGDLAGLELEYQEIVRATERTLGPEHPDTIQIRSNLAGLFYSQGNLVDSEAEYRSVLKIAERVLGKDAVDTIRLRIALANVWVMQGLRQGLTSKHLEAEGVYRNQLEVLEQAQGFPTPLPVLIRFSLAATLFNQQRLPEAESEYRAAIKLAEQVLGPANRQILDINAQLLNCLVAQGKVADAIKVYEESLVIAKKVFGPAHTKVFDLTVGLVGCLQGQGRLAEAIVIQEDTLSTYRRTLAPDHRFIVLILKNLVTLYEKSDNKQQADVLRHESVNLKQSPSPPTIPTGSWVADPAKLWLTVFFPWTTASDPYDNLEAWRQCATGESARLAEVPELSFGFGNRGPEEVVPGIKRDGRFGTKVFGMIASGKLRLGQGRWQVRVDADDGVRVWVNRKLVINEWVYPQAGTFAAIIEQNQPGDSEVEFVVEYFQNTGGANLKLAVVKE